MKALTIYQPWASLIMAGAKPFEFRQWDYSERYPRLIDQRIVIHASARTMRSEELLDIIERIDAGVSSLKDEIARPIVERLLALPSIQVKTALPLAHGLGTAIIGRARRVDGLFKGPDSDRVHQHMFAWPLTSIEPFMPPIPMRGAQGFWNWPERIAA